MAAIVDTKYALLVGINYVGTPNELKGCVNDVQSMKLALTTYFGYKPQNITIVTDGEATRERILNELSILCARPGATHAVFHYSGHGSYVRDTSGDESDGRDECLVPVDYERAGMIRDDELFALINRRLLPSCRLTCISDCCHSGTIFDLPFRYDQRGGGRYIKTERTAGLTNRVVVAFSGCADAQTSADAFLSGRSCGAMTAAFTAMLKGNGTNVTLAQAQVAINAFLAANAFQQRSLLTVSSNTNQACAVTAKLDL